MPFDEFDGNEDTVGNRILKRAARQFMSPEAQDMEEVGYEPDGQAGVDQVGDPVGARIVDLAAQKPPRRPRPSKPGPVAPVRGAAPGTPGASDLLRIGPLHDPLWKEQEDRSADELRMITEQQNFSRLPKPKSPAPNASINPHITPVTHAFASVTVPYSTKSDRHGMDNASRFAPLIMQAMKEQGLTDRDMINYAFATIHGETSTFAPGEEGQSTGSNGNTTPGGQPFDKYGPGTKTGIGLGNTEPGDGERFRGRGFVQLTGRRRYKEYGDKLHVDLVNNPELASDPTIAASFLLST